MVTDANMKQLETARTLVKLVWIFSISATLLYKCQRYIQILLMYAITVTPRRWSEP
jgi:hypothetical protein